MIELSTLSVFLLAVLALFLSPGPNMAFVLSYGIAHGARGGFAAALGITAADLVLTLLTATGITAVVAAWPPAFDILRYFGAMYLVWLAIQAIRSPGKAVITQRETTSMLRIARMAMLNSLFNPKALLFFMVFLPQFVHVERGNVAFQLAVLGVTLSTAALLFNTALGLFSGQIGKFLSRSTRAAAFQSRFLAGVLISLAVRLLFLDRPTAR
jgi:threonine/homoserine/homoserine lactone efflux protein